MSAHNDSFVPGRISFSGGGALDNLLLTNLRQALEVAELVDVSKELSDYYIWPIFLLGLPANLLALLTIWTLPRLKPESFLVALLSALDALALIAKLTGHQVSRTHAYLGPVGCKFQFLITFVTTLANWVLLMICADRFLSVCFPLSKRRLFTNRKCYLAVSLLALFFLIFFGTLGAVMRSSDASGLRCGTYNQYLWFWTNVWYWINATFFLFIPVLGLIPMTAWTVWTLRARAQASSGSSGKDVQSDEQADPEQDQQPTQLEKEEGAFTLMIILAAVVFVVLSLPACIYYLSYRSGSQDQLTRARWALFEQIQFVLIDSSHAVNFFLYFFSCKLFREQFFRLVTCRACRQSSFSPQQNTSTSDSLQ